jgi:tetratricopeptide (TPR) repeat protein
VLAKLGDLEGARSHHQQALEITEATLGPNHPAMATRHNNLGVVLRQLGNLEDARIEYERALDIGRATVGFDHRSIVIARRNLDEVLRQVAVGSAGKASVIRWIRTVVVRGR